MKKKTRYNLLSLVLIFGLISSSIPMAAGAKAVTPYTNTISASPLIWSDIPDLDIICVNSTYYMTSTTMHLCPGCPIMKSTDLVHWSIVNYVYNTLSSDNASTLTSGNIYGKGQWASSLRYNKGTYYVEFASNNLGKTFIYKTTNIETGTWTQCCALSGVYHDAGLLFDDTGKVYLVYGTGAIKAVELNSDCSGIKSGGLNKTLISNASAAAGTLGTGLAAEGTHIQKINGYYYIFNICWPQGGIRTETVYRSSSLTGTYTGQVFLGAKATNGDGIAQGQLIQTTSGNWYALLFEDHGAVGRIPYLVPVTWSNGWPKANTSGTCLQMNINGTNGIVSSDEFSGTTIGKNWQWNHNPNNSCWSLSSRSGYLRLKTGSISTSILNARNTLTQRTFGPTCSAIVAVDVSGMKDGDYAGLSAFQFYYGFVGVNMSGISKSIVMVNGSTNKPTATSSPVKVATVSLSQSRVYFKVSCNFTNRTDKANFYYSLNGTTWTKIGNPLSMSYTLPHFMGYRFGLFNYATKSAGGHADFDYFRVSSSL
jgi:beta-xylosidase